MAENVTRFGGELVLLQSEWGRAIDPAQVEAMLKDHPKVKLVAFVHAETSTGVALDAKAICSIAAKAGCLTIVDCVTSLAGIEVALDDWGADAAYSGTQKCLSCAPGLSPFSMSERAIEAIKAAQSPRCILVLGHELGDGVLGRKHHACLSSYCSGQRALWVASEFIAASARRAGGFLASSCDASSSFEGGT